VQAAPNLIESRSARNSVRIELARSGYAIAPSGNLVTCDFVVRSPREGPGTSLAAPIGEQVDRLFTRDSRATPQLTSPYTNSGSRLVARTVPLEQALNSRLTSASLASRKCFRSVPAPAACGGRGRIAACDR